MLINSRLECMYQLFEKMGCIVVNRNYSLPQTTGLLIHQEYDQIANCDVVYMLSSCWEMNYRCRSHYYTAKRYNRKIIFEYNNFISILVRYIKLWAFEDNE